MLELAAHLINPALGRVIDIAFKIQEALDDQEALASADSDRQLHVPLLRAGPGLEIELSVQLPGDDQADEDNPRVSGFVSPGDDGLSGGWAIELDKHAAAGEQKTEPSERPVTVEREAGPDEPTATERQRQPVGQKVGQIPVALISADLPKIARTDPLRRAAILRETAACLRDWLQSRPGLNGMPLIIIYDERAACGIWVIQSALPAEVFSWHVEIRLETTSDLASVFIN
jgi:hypothetical protein